MERYLDGVWFTVVFDGAHRFADADILQPLALRRDVDATDALPGFQREDYVVQPRQFKACPQCGISSISLRQKVCLRCRWRRIRPTRSEKELRDRSRKRTKRWYPTLKPCEVCATRDQVHRHHRDDDPLNNRPENIGFLCEYHHVAHHRRFATPTTNEYINQRILEWGLRR